MRSVDADYGPLWWGLSHYLPSATFVHCASLFGKFWTSVYTDCVPIQDIVTDTGTQILLPHRGFAPHETI